jgi:DMSO/TMAO reductase YedYZ molybdopterin-dependent catalytic subunit
MSRSRKYPSGIDARLLIRDAARLLPDPARRAFLRGGAGLGALALLSGCDIIDGSSAERALMQVSYFNDRVQAWLFRRDKLAPTYSDAEVTRPFPFNGYYPEDDAPEVDGEDYKFLVGGLVENKKSWTLNELYALPQETQITRLVCVEGWSAIGKWTGAPLREFLRRVGADLRAKYVWFRCAEGYSTSIDMATALHPQTQMTFQFDGQTLPRKYGFPMRVRIPTKLGFKNPKYVMEMAVTDKYLGGYWEDQGYNWFSGS